MEYTFALEVCEDDGSYCEYEFIANYELDNYSHEPKIQSIECIELDNILSVDQFEKLIRKDPNNADYSADQLIEEITDNSNNRSNNYQSQRLSDVLHDHGFNVFDID